MLFSAALCFCNLRYVWKSLTKQKHSKLAQAVTSDLYSGSTEFLHDQASKLIVNTCITTTNSLEQDPSQEVNYSWPFWPVNMGALLSLRTPGTTQRHTPQDMNFRNDAMTVRISQANSQWSSHQIFRSEGIGRSTMVFT